MPAASTFVRLRGRVCRAHLGAARDGRDLVLVEVEGAPVLPTGGVFLLGWHLEVEGEDEDEASRIKHAQDKTWLAMRVTPGEMGSASRARAACDGSAAEAGPASHARQQWPRRSGRGV